MASKRVPVEAAGKTVSVSSPDKVVFPEAGITKIEVVRYYVAVAEGALRGAGGRPNVMKRYPKGIGADFFFQKRAPTSRPEWLDTAVLKFPSGRTAEEVVPRDAAGLAWMAHMGCIDLNPHPVRAEDLDHPDELRVDLDPVPGVEWPQIVDVARVVKEALDDHGLVGWPKTSGSRGIHVNVRIHPRWSFDDVRMAALTLARDVERRVPKLATSAWWKEERHGVFLDYNQNAKDRTVASAYSIRPRPDARVSMPLTWESLFECDPADYTLKTVPALFEANGDAHAAIDEHPGSLDSLLELAKEHEAQGMGDAPWPPHYDKREGEPPRVQPSRAKKGKKTKGRRQPKHPLLTIAKAAKKADALEGLERWKAKYPKAAEHLEAADVLVDAMRGRYRTWTRIRVNLRNVPEGERPPEEAPDPDYDPSVEWTGEPDE
ncbi:MAG: DNA polymerase domain-containing protein [Deltaproteobacteria bacterium]|nr:DNA polymerase domain-containing protein [Deltaproteobacteria bacterium]